MPNPEIRSARSYRCAVGLSIVIVLFVASSARAQNVNEVFRPRVTATDACPSALSRTPKNNAELLACIRQLAEDVGATPDAPPTQRIANLPKVPASVPDQDAAEIKHGTLLQYYAAYLEAKRKTSVVAGDERATMDASLDLIGPRVHRLLQAHGIEETAPLTGELRAGSALSDAGVPNSAAGGSSQDANSSADALAHIVWSTTHAGAVDKTSGSDVSLSGTVGLQPTMTLLRSESGSIDAKYQQALVIGASLDLGAFRGRTETTTAVRGGFVRLGDLAQIVEKDGRNEVALPVGSADKVAPYVEAVVRFALFDRPMTLVHLTHTEMSPRLSLEFGYAYNSRFSNLGTIEDAPSQLVTRLMIDGLEIIDKRTEPVRNKTFAASFGFEYRKGFGSLPDGFSFLIRGDLDLLKALKGGHVDRE